jgi:5-methylcytosine-specific restriction endonuclease McrA
MPPRLGKMPPSLAFMPDGRCERDRVRDAQPWRRWYRTSRWKKLRALVLLRDLYTCQRCRRIEGNTSMLVADHRRPHRGDETLFWSETNLWTLCKPCHDGWKQREEQNERVRGF